LADRITMDKEKMPTHYGPSPSSYPSATSIWCPYCELYHHPEGACAVPLNPRIAEHQDWMETNSRFAHACPDLDQELPEGLAPDDMEPIKTPPMSCSTARSITSRPT
jgi:hypothetical protein